MKDESPPPSQAKSDELQRAIVNLVEVANGLSSHSFEDAWGKVQSSMKHLRKRVQGAQANVQDYVSSNVILTFGYVIFGKLCRGSFSAVSKPHFASTSKYM